MFFYPSSMLSFTTYFWSRKISAQNITISVLVVVFGSFLNSGFFPRIFFITKNKTKKTKTGQREDFRFWQENTDRKGGTIKIHEIWKRPVFWKEGENGESIIFVKLIQMSDKQQNFILSHLVLVFLQFFSEWSQKLLVSPRSSSSVVTLKRKGSVYYGTSPWIIDGRGGSVTSCLWKLVDVS